MADEKEPGTGTVDLAALQTTVANLSKAVEQLVTGQTETAKNLEIVSSTLAKLPPAAPADEKKSDEKPGKDGALTESRLLELLDQRDAKSRESQQKSQEREAYVSGKLKDLPAVYQGKLGTDPAKWAAEEQVIRSEFQADMKALGVTPKNLGTVTTPTGTPASDKPVDESKKSGMELLDEAVVETNGKVVSAGEQTVNVVQAGNGNA